MGTPINFNGVSYTVPAFGDVGYAQGPGNLSAYLIAIATGALQQTGGSFPLTSQVNFGNSFGITAVDFISTTANPATVGTLRLAKTDAVDWRNNANTLNLPLAINGSDQLTFNGNIISGTGAGPVQTVSGTANQINSTGGANPVLSLSSTLIIPGTFTIPAVTNQIVLGTTNTTTLTSPAPAASRTYTIPDVLTNASFVMTAGNQSIAGVKTFSDQTLFSNGSAAAPSISFSSDLNTGFFWPSADAINLVTGGTTRISTTTTNVSIALPISMNNLKITSLADGTAATDAAAFGQIHVPQIAKTTLITGGVSTTSATFVDVTSLSVTITPTSVNSKILVWVSGALGISNLVTASAIATIVRDSTNLGDATFGLSSIDGSGASTPTQIRVPCAMTVLDSPATTSATTYKAQFRTTVGTTTTATFGLGSSTITVMEVI